MVWFHHLLHFSTIFFVEMESKNNPLDSVGRKVNNSRGSYFTFGLLQKGKTDNMRIFFANIIKEHGAMGMDRKKTIKTLDHVFLYLTRVTVTPSLIW